MFSGLFLDHNNYWVYCLKHIACPNVCRPHPTSWRPEYKRLKECSLLQLLRLTKFSLCTVRLCTSLLLGLEYTRVPNEAHTVTSSRPLGWTGNYTPAILSLQIANFKSRNSSASIHVNQFLKNNLSLSLLLVPCFVWCVYMCVPFTPRDICLVGSTFW